MSFLGYRPPDELAIEIQKSLFVVLPSEWYENNPRSVLEAFAYGKCVVASRIGGIPELVKDGETGLTFTAGDTEELKGKISFLIRSREEIMRMGKFARQFCVENFNEKKHYKKLMDIYSYAVKRRRSY